MRNRHTIIIIIVSSLLLTNCGGNHNAKPGDNIDIIGTWAQEGKTNKGFYIEKNPKYDHYMGMEYLWIQFGTETRGEVNASFNKKEGRLVLFFQNSSTSVLKYNYSTEQFELSAVGGIAKFSKIN